MGALRQITHLRVCYSEPTICRAHCSHTSPICPPPGNRPHPLRVVSATKPTGDFPMKGALAWLIGIPIPIIIVLYLLDVF